jgi:aminomethyltransferase
MPLYGHELDRTISPVEAGLGFAIRPEGGFVGALRVLRELKDGPGRRLVGLRIDDRRVPRQGYVVLAGDRAVGLVTSGTLSPTLGTAIGMALVEAPLAAPGTRLTVDVRGSHHPAEVVPLPFYRRQR